MEVKEFALPKNLHRWPFYSSKEKLLNYLADDQKAALT